MKNIYLIIAVIIVTTFIYLKYEIKLFEAPSNNKNILMIKNDDLRIISLPNASLIKKGHSFFTSRLNYQVSNINLNSFLERISYLKVHRIFSNFEKIKFKENDLFEKKAIKFTFHFLKKTIKYRLGKLSPLKKFFYIEVIDGENVTWLLAKDTSPTNFAYLNESQKYQTKYIHLQSKLLLPENYFQDKNIFLKSEIKQPIKIKVENIRNRSFTIDFNNNSTTPAILPGLHYNFKAINNYLQNILNLMSTKIYPVELQRNQYLDNKVSTIEIIDINKKSYFLQIYRKFGKLNGLFLKTSFDQTIFKLDEKKSSLYFSNAQDFWSKKIIFSKNYGTKNESFSIIIDNGKSETLSINRSQEFIISSSRHSVNIKQFKLLFTYLFGLKKANHCSSYDKSFKQSIKNKKQIEFVIDNKKIIFTQLKDELIITNIKDKYNLHFWVGKNNSISFKRNNYFNNSVN